MQQLGSKTFTVDGVTVFSDHADPDQFWYLPAPVSLARRAPGDRAQFTLIKFKPATANAGVKGGGFLMIETELVLSAEAQRKILSQCARLSNGAPRLAVVPFDEGSVQCIALNLQGPGGTSAAPAGSNALTFVEQILGASAPSLQGNNSAAFSVKLSQEGATVLEQVFKEGGGPVGVIYQLKYTILRPALDVEITANFKRVFDSLKLGVDFSAGFLAGGVPVYLKAGLDAAFEKLKQDGIIQIKVINSSNAADAAEKEKWALDFFREKLMADWFAPTLPPVQFPSQGSGNGVSIPGIGLLPSGIPGLSGNSGNSGERPAGGAGHGSAPGGSSGGTAGGGSAGSGSAGSGASGGSGGSSTAGPGSGSSSGSSGSRNAGAGSGSSGGNSGSGTGSGSSTGGSATGRTSGSSASGASAGAGGGGTGSGPRGPTGSTRSESTGIANGASLTESTETTLPRAVLTETGRTPTTSDSEEYRIDFAPSASGIRETLTFLGGEAPPVVTVNGSPQTLNGRQLALDAAAGAMLDIRAEYPPAAPSLTNFFLFFDRDKPALNGFSAVPPSTLYQSYLNNQPTPSDARFQMSDGTVEPLGNSTIGGAAALRDWLRSELAEPRRVTVDAHASYENDDGTGAFNLQLSQRRRQVSIGIIGNLAQVTGGTAHGFADARAAQPPRIGDPGDRHVRIAGMSPPGTPVTLTATLARPAAAASGSSGPGGSSSGSGTSGSSGSGTPGTAGTGGTGDRPGTSSTSGTSGTRGTGGTAGTGGSGATPGMGVSLAFKLQIVQQQEDKNVTLRYTRTEAVQQTYNPQNFIGLLTQDIGPGHFFEVDLDDPFFRTIDIVAEAPIDFNRIGLISTQLSLDYGSPDDLTVGVKHKDMTFDKTRPQQQTFSVFMNKQRETAYALGLQYHFDPLSGWEGERLSYTLPTRSTEDRTLLVNPFEDFGFLELKVIPGDIDWSAVNSTDVHLHYEDPGVFARNTVITLTPETPEQFWKLRLTHPDRRTVTYFFEHHLVDGSVRTGPTRTTTASTIAVDDSFDAALDIEFIPVFDGNEIETVFAEVFYEDTAHLYKREARLEFGSGSDGNSGTLSGSRRQRLHIALFDPALTTYRLTYTIVGKDHSVRRLLPINTGSTLVFVGETF